MRCETRRLVLGVLGTLAFSGLTHAQEVLTLERALSLAFEHNRHVANAELEVDKAEDAVGVLRGDRYPRIGLRGGSRYNLTTQGYLFKEGVFGDFPVIGPVPPENTEIESETGLTSLLSLSIVQPLTQLHVVGLAVDRQEAIAGMAEERARASRHEIAKQVKDQYYEILQLQSDLASTEEAIAFYRELDGLVSRYVEEQVALAYEGMEVAARLARKQHDELRERNRLETARERMNALLGRDIATPFTVETLPLAHPGPVATQQALNEALEQRPDVREARLRTETAELDRRMQKSGYYPDVDFRVGMSKLYGVEFVPDTIATVGVLLSWDISDWGQRHLEVAQANDSIRQATHHLEQTETDVAVEIERATRSLTEAEQSVPVAELHRSAAREKLRVRMNQYREQTILLDDLLEAESELEQANTGYTRAVLSVRKAEAELDRAMGRE